MEHAEGADWISELTEDIFRLGADGRGLIKDDVEALLRDRINRHKDKVRVRSNGIAPWVLDTSVTTSAHQCTLPTTSNHAKVSVISGCKAVWRKLDD